jgi:hypothetical protein
MALVSLDSPRRVQKQILAAGQLLIQVRISQPGVLGSPRTRDKFVLD